MGSPQNGIKESLQKLRDMGYEIHIVSCRTSQEVIKYSIDRQEQVRLMKEYLSKYKIKIPYDRILNNDKALGNLYIDDRGVGFRGNGEKIIKEIEEFYK